MVAVGSSLDLYLEDDRVPHSVQSWDMARGPSEPAFLMFYMVKLTFIFSLKNVHERSFCRSNFKCCLAKKFDV